MSRTTPPSIVLVTMEQGPCPRITSPSTFYFHEGGALCLKDDYPPKNVRQQLSEKTYKHIKQPARNNISHPLSLTKVWALKSILCTICSFDETLYHHPLNLTKDASSIIISIVSSWLVKPSAEWCTSPGHKSPREAGRFASGLKYWTSF